MKLNLKLFLLLFLVLFTFRINAQGFGKLVNANSTKETVKLKVMLDSLYGKKILSGQVDDKYLQYIINITGGKSPAIMGYDFNGICPSQGGNNDATKAINWVRNKGGIAQFQWHWISPNADGDFYTKNYNLAAALGDTNSSSYKNLIRDMDLAAKEIKKMQDANVPILWRPLHEAEGKWFWWGMSGGDACKKLYRLMYERFTKLHKLNNLIWVWNSYGTTKENWYPGDDVVDIISYDYPDYANSSGSWSQYQKMFGSSNKLFGIGEDGKLFDPNLFSNQPWLYFLTWSYMIEEPSVKDGKNPKDWVFKVYNDPRVITLEDLQPGLKSDAGISQTVYDNDGDGFEEVTLDGSGSKDDFGTIVFYEWKEGSKILAQEVKAKVKLSVGTHNISLTVTSSNLSFKTSYTVVTVKKVSASTNKRVIVTTTEANSTNVSANAVDGDLSTRWSSVYSDPQWIAVDLGSQYSVDAINFYWHSSSAKNYFVDISDDGIAWKVISTQTNKPAGQRTDSLKNLNAKGRFVRMYGLERTTTLGYSLWEFEVYGKPTATSVEQINEIPREFSLKQNYPNPFNPSTTISYNIPAVDALSGDEVHVTLKVYDILGNEVATLVDEVKQPGFYNSQFSIINSQLSSGVYFYKLTAGTFSESKKMILIK